ncbi:hypothetical protein MFMK1_002461 [Metallumcola ferriviriculae]|uniref:CN hydrolase domain-containing protein n=1 Tax=Metallumcola ferriviriculae TaxID=3039180 RepID=A0AAU0UPU9_9FIRM|nr:hypothetical protein MFMK1_002461 [Desulfitibacteraceae bacterium MK1]
MKVGVVQMAPVFGDVKVNVEKALGLMDKADADLLVLPELFSTGYQFVNKEEVMELAEEVPNGFTCEKLSEAAREKNIFIVAGMAEKGGENYYNSAVLIGPKGFVGRYRKAHLFYEEKFWFTPGDIEFPVFDIGKAKIGLMICFDWVFPEVSRILALKGAQIICQPANLVLPYCQSTMISRSIENRCFSITCNRVGIEKRKEEELDFTGMSQVINPKGEVMLTMGEVSEGLEIVEIDPALADDKLITTHNDVIKDRRTDLFGKLL